MQRKYHPTEKDAARAEEDDEPEQPKKKGPMKKVMADFFKLRYISHPLSHTLVIIINWLILGPMTNLQHPFTWPLRNP